MATPAAAPVPSHPAPRRSRLAATLARRHNPLWRRTDSLRSRLRILLVLALIAVAALSALLALGLYRSDRAAAARHAATLRQTQAVALTNAGQSHVGYGANFTAEIRWTGPTGAAHESRAAVDPGTVPGTKVTVWLDSADQVTAPPVSVADSAGRAVLLGGLSLLGGGVLTTVGASLARSRLNRADLRNWDQAWQVTEPTWTRRI